MLPSRQGRQYALFPPIGQPIPPARNYSQIHLQSVDKLRGLAVCRPKSDEKNPKLSGFDCPNGENSFHYFPIRKFGVRTTLKGECIRKRIDGSRWLPMAQGERS